MSISKDQINTYQALGVVKITDIISKKKANTLIKNYNSFIKNNKILSKKNYGKLFSYLKSKKKPSSLHNLQKFKKNYFYKFAREKKLNIIADQLVGRKTKMSGIQFFIKNTDSNLPTTAHQDNAYWCYKNFKGLSFWIALNKTNKKNGCMYYYKKSHLKDVRHYKNVYVPGTTFFCKEPKSLDKVYYNLSKGDCAVHDSRTIHGSFKNTSKNKRIALVITFIEKKAKKNKLMLKKYLKNYEFVKKVNLKKFN